MNILKSGLTRSSKLLNLKSVNMNVNMIKVKIENNGTEKKKESSHLPRIQLMDLFRLFFQADLKYCCYKPQDCLTEAKLERFYFYKIKIIFKEK